MDATTPIEIEDRPWGMAALLFLFAVTSIVTFAMSLSDGQVLAAVCAAVLFFACLLAASKAIRFSRVTLFPDGTASYAFRDLNGWRQQEFPAGSLRAGVQSHWDSDGKTGRVMLLIDGADGVTRIPFTGYFGSPNKAAETVARIMAWREATRTA